MRNPRIGVLLIVCLAATTSSAAAQTSPPPGRLIVSVADPSGAMIPQPLVAVVQEDDAQAPPIAPVVGSDRGVAVIERLAPGRYTVRVEFSGFETVTLTSVRVRAGDNRRAVTLPIKKVAEDVTVGRDGRSRALDPRGSAFSSVLTREQIAMLPDDPEEMEAMLKAMAPPGSVLRVDGFTGGRLPPKSQIRSIRLPRMDMLAAQNHGGFGGMLHIDVLTQPGHGPLRGTIDAAFRDDALNARNPFTSEKGSEGLRRGGLSLSGTIVQDRSSFAVSAQRSSVFDTGNLLAATPDGTRAEPIRRPADRLAFDARFDQTLSQGHVLAISYQRSTTDLRNLGAGGFDLPDRAFSTSSSEDLLRMSENGPIGRRFFSESRLQLRWSATEARSALEAPAIRVLDAFTAGGAQRRGGSRLAAIEAATDLDYVRGAHAFRTGVLFERASCASDDVSNYLGMWTFASLADFEAGQPSSFTRRDGAADVRYRNMQVGLYVQDDHRAHESLMLSYGARYETQSLAGGWGSLSPRVSVTWSPDASGRTTLRGGFGSFADWLPTDVFEQTLRVDGRRQREINVLNPSWPDAPTEGTFLPANRYALADDLERPEAMLVTAGIERVLPAGVRLNATYSYRRGSRLLRGRNLNAPVDGVRPDPSLANIVEVTGDAASRQHQLGVTAGLVRLEWRQTFLATSYVLSSLRTNTAGAFALPASGDDLAAEWAPAAPRHRWILMFNTRPVASLGVNLMMRAQSGTPYTITTGTDDNGDGVFNDRPSGVARNSTLTAGQLDAALRLSWTIGFGPARDGGSGTGQAIVIGAGGGGMSGGLMAGSKDRRFRLEMYAFVQNVANRRNYVGYSGVLTSPFFGQPTNVLNPRKVELGLRFGF